MSLGQRMADAMNRVYDRMRDPAVFRIGRQDGTAGSFEVLRGHKYGLVITFRRDGRPVPSPVWMAVDPEGRAYFGTAANSAKVRRIGNDPAVLIAPSTVRGRPKGPVLRGSARVLPREEWDHAEATLAAAFGLGRRLYESAFRPPEELTAYVEVVAAG